MVGYIGPKAIQYNVDNSVVEGDSSIGGDSSVGGNLTVDGNLQVNGSISPPYPTVANANILINPSFTVNQRGDVIDHNTESYGPDRWRVRGISQLGGTMSQSSTVVDPATGINKLVVKHRNATSFSYIYQFIEAVNLQGLYSKEMTLSFGYEDTGGSGIPFVQLLSFDSSGNYQTLYDAVPTSLGGNRWACTITLSAPNGNIPVPSEKGMQVLIYPNGTNAAPAEWSVWETKLEVGSVATPFIARSYGEELLLCQRYYQVFGIDHVFAGRGGSTTTIAVSVIPFVELRATPTIPFNVNARAYSISGSTSDTNSTLTLARYTSAIYVTFAGFNSVITDNRVGTIQLAQNMPVDAEL